MNRHLMTLSPENQNYCGSLEAWKEKHAEILKRAENKCENCGVKNHATGYRRKDKNKTFVNCEGMAQESASIDGEKLITIVLTISHIDHNPQNNHGSNLRALCQRCHLRHDAKHHATNRRVTIRKKKKLDNTLF
jgi:hypothetical protein